MSQSPRRIDVHHHFLPPEYTKALSDSGGDPSGWPTPQWSVESTKQFMATHNISTAILSLSAPGTTLHSLSPPAALHLARTVNLSAASIRDSSPTSFGFFATLPPLTNLSDALSELTYALDVLHADGVTLLTRYDTKYLGHPTFTPIWDELDRRSAVIFIHPTHSADTTLVSPQLPQPAIDFPHETTRAAVDLLLSGTIRAHPNCKVILSHAGGTLPYIAARPASILSVLPGGVDVSAEEFMDGARGFYFDLALSGGEYTLGLLEKFAKPGRMLYGSDYPYAGVKAIDGFVGGIEGFEWEGGEEVRRGVERGNAEVLFPRLKGV